MNEPTMEIDPQLIELAEEFLSSDHEVTMTEEEHQRILHHAKEELGLNKPERGTTLPGGAMLIPVFTGSAIAASAAITTTVTLTETSDDEEATTVVAINPVQPGLAEPAAPQEPKVLVNVGPIEGYYSSTGSSVLPHATGWDRQPGEGWRLEFSAVPLLEEQPSYEVPEAFIGIEETPQLVLTDPEPAPLLPGLPLPKPVETYALHRLPPSLFEPTSSPLSGRGEATSVTPPDPFTTASVQAVKSSTDPTLSIPEPSVSMLVLILFAVLLTFFSRDRKPVVAIAGSSRPAGGRNANSGCLMVSHRVQDEPARGATP